MEQRLSVKCQRLIGTSVFPPGTFYEGKRFESGDRETAAARGTLFALLTLVGPASFDAVAFGQAILDSLEEEYFGHLEPPPLAALEKAIFSAHRRLSDMALAAHLSQSLEFNLVTAVSWGKVLYLGRLGTGAIYLLREGKVSEVVLTETSQVAVGSGFVYDGDSLILGSPDFRTFFPAATIGGVLPKIEEHMTALAGQASLVGLVLKFQLSEIPGSDEEIRFIEPTAGRVGFSLRSVLLFAWGGLKELFGRRPRRSASPEPGIDQRSVGQFSRSEPVLRPARRVFRKFKLGLALVALLGLFVLSVTLTINKARLSKLKSFTKTSLSQAEDDLTQAQDLAKLNDVEAQKFANKSLVALEKLEALGIRDSRLSEDLAATRKLLAAVSKIVASAPHLLYDFELSQKGTAAQATNLAGNPDSLFFANRAGALIWRFRLGSPKEPERIDQGKVKEPQLLSAFGERLFILTGSGVDFIDLKKGTVENDVVAGLAVKDVADFESYNGNLYFLLPLSGKLERSLATASGFGRPVNWLKSEVNLEKTERLAVSGAIFLLRQAQVLKFEGGRQVDFNLSGFGQKLAAEVKVYPGAAGELYLVEPKNLRIYKFNDQGAYQKTYDLRASQVGSVDSLFVNPASQKIYFAAGAKIYELDP